MRARLIIPWLVWFAVLNLLWLVFISAFVPEETVLGLFASALAATAAVAVGEQRLIEFRLRLRWLLEARRLPAATLRESAAVLGVLTRRLTERAPVRGTFRTVRVRLPTDPAESAGKRALLIAGESFAPNRYILGIDEERGLALVHELVREGDE